MLIEDFAKKLLIERFNKQEDEIINPIGDILDFMPVAVFMEEYEKFEEENE